MKLMMRTVKWPTMQNSPQAVVWLCLFMLLIVNSCKKQSANESKNAEEAVKSGFYRNGYEGSLKFKLDDSSYIKFEPRWEGISTKSKDNGTTYYFVPLDASLKSSSHDNSDGQRVNLSGWGMYLVVRDTKGTGLVYYTGKYYWAADVSNQTDYENFTGDLILTDFSGKKEVYTYQQVDASSEKKKANSTSEKVFATASSTCVQVCTYNGKDALTGIFTVAVTRGTASSTGCPIPQHLVQWRIVESEYSCSDNPGDPPPTPGGGGSGGSGGTGGSVSANGHSTVDTINTTQLTTPCLISAVNLALSHNLKSNIVMAFNNLFALNEDMEIIITEGNLGSGVYATTFATNAYTIEITLNSQSLPNASQELVVSTILHEAIHAMYDYKGISLSAPHLTFDEYIQHNLMASMYVDEIARSTMEVFPSLPQYDAKALAWEGLEDGLSWGAIDPTEQNHLLLAGDDYDENHTKGTRCH